MWRAENHLEECFNMYFFEFPSTLHGSVANTTSNHVLFINQDFPKYRVVHKNVMDKFHNDYRIDKCFHVFQITPPKNPSNNQNTNLTILLKHIKNIGQQNSLNCRPYCTWNKCITKFCMKNSPLFTHHLYGEYLPKIKIWTIDNYHQRIQLSHI